jgi:prepilin-type N-terminal cleavage/methylation domain-containing protein
MQRFQSGFTLVELAIVLMIIGLLIGGILKGQELIQNARITSFVAQTKSVSAALLTFQDSYGALPGDIPNPGTRLPNCTATNNCNAAGNGNGMISDFGMESTNSVNHLGKANVLSGFDTNSYPGSPTTPFGGYFFIQTRSMDFTATPIPRGHYLSYYNDIANMAGDFITTPQAARIDRKIDDGLPRSGSVIATEGYDVDYTTTGNCLNGTAYAETSPSNFCSLLIGL